MIQLRDYQKTAVEAVYHHLRNHDDNPVVVIPTGGGKTPVMATLCHDAVNLWNGRVLILAHVKELLEQTADTLSRMAPELSLGVYSAGLKRKDTEHPVIVAGIQSIYRRALDLDPFDIVIIDESHMIPPEGDGMYRTFLNEACIVNPKLRVIGLTATPFRMTTGLICQPDHFLNSICYEVGIKELIRDGYLCPLRSKASKTRVDTSVLHIRGGEFIATEMEELMDTDARVKAACAEIVEYTRDRKAVLIFASGVAHGKHIQQIFEQDHHIECGFVSGDSPDGWRRKMIEDFRTGKLKYLCNVNVLTTGFDAPNIDCIALLRPTMSPGLYYQMCLDMETEVLTQSGWRKCHQVAIGDKVASFDLQTEQIVYVPAQDKVHRAMRSHESMYGVTSPHLDIRVTDLHNMVVRCKSHSTRHWQLQPASQAALRQDTYLIPISGSGANYAMDAPLSDAEVAFLGWFLMDGYRNRANGTVMISQSTIKYADAIRAVLRDCGFGYREYPIRRKGNLASYPNGILFVIPKGQPRGNNSGKTGWSRLALWVDKDIPSVYDTLSVRQFGILLGAMDLANGHHPTHLSYRKKTMDIAMGCRQRLADRIQQLAIERGFRCNMSEIEPKPSSWNQTPQKQYKVFIRPQRYAYLGGLARHTNHLVPNRCKLAPVSYERNEWVWCLTTEHGTLVTRRHGKVAVMGNCGRGFRLHESKTDCLVLDFGGNIVRHGPIDCLRVTDVSAKGDGEAPAKECPQCREVIHAAYARCPVCGFEFPPPEKTKHDTTASSEGVLSDQVRIENYQVQEVLYNVHTKKGAEAGSPRTMRVQYKIGYGTYVSEWICFEHTGFARIKAEGWWRQRSNDPVPQDSEMAVFFAEQNRLREPIQITVRSVSGEKFPQITGYQFDNPQADPWQSNQPLPEYVPAEDEIPF